jgi:hypothetical protein
MRNQQTFEELRVAKTRIWHTRKPEHVERICKWYLSEVERHKNMKEEKGFTLREAVTVWANEHTERDAEGKIIPERVDELSSSSLGRWIKFYKDNGRVYVPKYGSRPMKSEKKAADAPAKRQKRDRDEETKLSKRSSQGKSGQVTFSFQELDDEEF